MTTTGDITDTRSLETSIVEAIASAESKRKVTKIPVFTGDKSDALSPSEFVDRVETAAKAAKWSTAEKAFQFTLALEGPAAKWFKVTADDREDEWQEQFDEIAKEFIAWFEPAATGTRTLAGVKDMKQRSTEKVPNFAIRVKEAVLLWRRFAPMPDFAKSVEERTMVRAGIRIGFDQMGLAMFCLGLHNAEMQQKVLDASPKTLDEAIKLAVDLEIARSSLKETKEATVTKVAMVNEGEAEEDDEDGEVDAIKGRGGFNKKNGQNKRSTQNGSASGGKAQFSCYYCKKPGHRQNRCFKRIQENGPMVDRYGKPLPNYSVTNNAPQVQPVYDGTAQQNVSMVRGQTQPRALNFLGV